MHTYAPDDNIRFFHNGGFDGDVLILDKSLDREVRVSSDDLLKYALRAYLGNDPTFRYQGPLPFEVQIYPHEWNPTQLWVEGPIGSELWENVPDFPRRQVEIGANQLRDFVVDIFVRDRLQTLLDEEDSEVLIKLVIPLMKRESTLEPLIKEALDHPFTGRLKSQTSSSKPAKWLRDLVGEEGA